MANDATLRQKEEFFSTIFNFFLPNRKSNHKTTEKECCHPHGNQNLQKSLLKSNAKAINMTKSHLVKNKNMINGLVSSLKSINITVYHSILTIQRLNYGCNIFLMLADLDPRLNELYNGLGKLESDMSTIYSYINTLSYKIVTPTLINPVDLKTILNNVQTVIPLYLSLSMNLIPTSGPFMNF